MSCLVLAAGLGTRLDPLTRLVAKPAVPLGDRTLIEHVLTWLHEHGVRDVVINLHHLPATITAVVGDGAHLGLAVRYSWEPQILGSAGGPRHALALVDSDPFLIVNGDTLCDFDLAPMLAAHRDRDAHVTMALVPNPAPDHYNGLQLDDDDVVTGFVQRGSGVASWHFVGTQVARRSVFADLPDGVPAETVAGHYREIVKRFPGRIRGWRVSTSFLDVGTPRDYLTASIVKAGTTAASDRIGDSVVWPNATIGTNVTLTRSIVAGGVVLPDGFMAQDSIVVPAGVAGPGDHVQIREGVAVYPFSD